MALPKINDAPKYSLTIPSTQKRVSYRPFLVKEEKILMLASETKDPQHLLTAIVDTIEACVDTEIDRNSLTSFDVEYMFTQIRAKSVGERATFGVGCSTCNHTNTINVKLDDIKIDVPKTKNIIKLNDKYSLKMKWPKYNEVVHASTKLSDSVVEQSFDLIVLCIDSVLTDEESIKLSDEPREEILSFLESLNSAQFKSISEYVEKMPKLKHDIVFKCESCGADNHHTLQGMQDFFR